MLSKGRFSDNAVSNGRQSVLRSVRTREIAKWKAEIVERGSDLEGGLVRRWKIFARSTEIEVMIVPYAGDEQANVSPTAAVRLDTVCALSTLFPPAYGPTERHHPMLKACFSVDDERWLKIEGSECG